jgi:tRNA pseudouridine32 synthase / 23S rRNA pseudouridine746 synthase
MLRLFFAHPDFFVFLKSTGLSFHQENGKSGLMDLARQLTQENNLFPVHRLDQMTSGLVLVARHAHAAHNFGHLFTQGKIEKHYLALSAKAPRKKQGWIKGSHVKGRNGSWRLGPMPSPEELNPAPVAITQFISTAAQTGHRLFILRPHTGRTHQLRVAMKSLGSPILGDDRYGGAHADRGYLHAWSLRFDWHDLPQHFSALPNQGEKFLDGVVQEKLAQWPASDHFNNFAK